MPFCQFHNFHSPDTFQDENLMVSFKFIYHHISGSIIEEIERSVYYFSRRKFSESPVTNFVCFACRGVIWIL